MHDVHKMPVRMNPNESEWLVAATLAIVRYMFQAHAASLGIKERIDSVEGQPATPPKVRGGGKS